MSFDININENKINWCSQGYDKWKLSTRGTPSKQASTHELGKKNLCKLLIVVEEVKEKKY